MESNIVLFLIIVLIIMGLICVFFHYRYKAQVRVANRIRYENVCSMLEVSGKPFRLEYHRLFHFWTIFKEETGNKFLFQEKAVLVITSQIKGCKTFEEIVDHFDSFDRVVQNKTLPEEEITLVNHVHKKVCENVVSRVMTLAQARCQHIRSLQKGEEKERRLFRLKQDLSLLAFGFFPHANYEFFVGVEKSKFKFKKKETPVIPFSSSEEHNVQKA